MIKRIAHCDICGLSEEEKMPGDGWQNWGELNGIRLRGAANPMLCPSCLTRFANKLEELLNGME